ncbi:MAG: IS200/IS605 family transposase [Deltaproteobacteria bacterium]|nr:IS200/IS605 family transposase [Deltaproteobacteria bacterium]
MVLSVLPKYSISELIRFFKGKSSIKLFDMHLELKKRYWERHFWAKEYCVSTIGLNEEYIKKYEAYTNFNLEEEKAGRGVTSGLYKPTVVEKSQKVSTTGLGLFPGPFKMIKVVMNLGEITHIVGADGFLQINFKVGKGKQSKPVLQEFNILLSADLRSQEVGFKGNKKMRYDFYTQWTPIVKLKKDLISTDDVLDCKKGPLKINNRHHIENIKIHLKNSGFTAYRPLQ